MTAKEKSYIPDDLDYLLLLISY